LLQRNLTSILIWETKKRYRAKEIQPSMPTLGKWDYEISVIVFDSVMLSSSFLAWVVNTFHGAAEPENPAQGNICREKALSFALLKSWHWLWLK
jgi:hypothetical protein